MAKQIAASSLPSVFEHPDIVAYAAQTERFNTRLAELHAEQQDLSDRLANPFGHATESAADAGALVDDLLAGGLTSATSAIEELRQRELAVRTSIGALTAALRQHQKGYAAIIGRLSVEASHAVGAERSALAQSTLEAYDAFVAAVNAERKHVAAVEAKGYDIGHGLGVLFAPIAPDVGERDWRRAGAAADIAEHSQRMGR